MNKSFHSSFCALFLTSASLMSTRAQPIPDPVQSPVNPYKMKLAGPVMEGGSDAAAKSFLQNVLPGAIQFIKKALPEGKNNTKSAAFQIDPNKLKLATDANVRAYFVYEGAAYHNSVGLDTVTSGSDPRTPMAEVKSPNSELIFPDASSTAGAITDGKSKPGTRTVAEPVLAGDFVDLGKRAAGSKLDFFLLANSADHATPPVWTADSTINGDGFKKHVAAFTSSLFAAPSLNSPYIFVSFEDLSGGGDKDFNDTIVAIDIGAKNVAALMATPEPSMWLTLGSLLVVAFWARRSLDRSATVTG